jgi:hypothetical protein
MVKLYQLAKKRVKVLKNAVLKNGIEQTLSGLMS